MRVKWKFWNLHFTPIKAYLIYNYGSKHGLVQNHTVQNLQNHNLSKALRRGSHDPLNNKWTKNYNLKKVAKKVSFYLEDYTIYV